MSDDIFRFMVVRPHQLRDYEKTKEKLIKSYGDPDSESTLHQDLKEVRETGTGRTQMIKVADEFIESAKFVSDLAKLKTPLNKLDKKITFRGSSIKLNDLITEVKHIFKDTTGSDDYKSFIISGKYKEERRRIADSLIATSIQQKDFVQIRTLLIRGLRLCGLLERLVADENSLKKKGAISKILRGIVLQPSDLFPLPPLESKETKREKLLKMYEEEKKKEENNREEILKMVKHVDDLKNALDEIVKAYDSSSLERRRAMVSDIKDKSKNKMSYTLGDKSWLLTESHVKKLSDSTMNILHSHNIPDDYVYVRDVVTMLETEIDDMARVMYYGAGKVAVAGKGFADRVYVGDGWAMAGRGFTRPEHELEPPLRQVGIPSAPSGSGSVTPIGMADLLIVRQEIQKYEAGEVAHIENILKGEFKERTHRRTTTREEIITEEIERTEETERDLQSTERFELKLESEQTIKEDMKFDAGIEVTASYGPTVKVKADAGFAYERAKEESKSAATSYSREVTERAVSRIQERVREERIRKIREEIEERNEHGIDNKTSSDHIIGIYRWVDKIYKAEIVNYGQRLMFEFTIPEPAAFYRFAETNTPIEGITMEKPKPPGSGVGNGFEPLFPVDICTTNYLYWVGKYNVPDVSPPPPEYKIISTAFDEDRGTALNEVKDRVYTKSIKAELVVPDGYLAKEAWFRWTSSGGSYREAVVFIGKEGIVCDDKLMQQVLLLNDEDGIVPIAVRAAPVDKYAATVEVSCKRTKDKLKRWQMDTYISIMTAYNELKAKYDEQLAAAQIQAGIAIRGRNPLKNREIEKTELKKSAISILTDQNFDLFDAMRKEVPPHKYPQMDIEEADVEGKHIQFFEQAFEWTNMTYLFYPYFWGRKEDWVLNSHLEDTDPIFEKFLKAGAARVQVPVRCGYDEVILHYLETEGEIWEGGDPPHVDNELYVSIVDAIQEEQGVELTEGEGTIFVANDGATITGEETEFDEDKHTNREIIIKGFKYRIAEVQSPTSLKLTEKYRGTTEYNITYYFGVQFVGEPWEVKIPTSLVYLQEDSELPDWTKKE